MPSTLGQKVKLFRQQAGLNQRELSRASQVSQASISRLEAGQVQAVHAESLRKIAEVLQVQVGVLLGDPEEVPAAPPVDEAFEWFHRLSADHQHWVRTFACFLELMAQCGPACPIPGLHTSPEPALGPKPALAPGHQPEAAS